MSGLPPKRGYRMEIMHIDASSISFTGPIRVSDDFWDNDCDDAYFPELESC